MAKIMTGTNASIGPGSTPSETAEQAVLEYERDGAQ